MRRWQSTGLEWARALGIACLTLLALYGGAILWLTEGMAPSWLTKETAPAWAQAIFSVIGIAVAIFLSFRDRERHEHGELTHARLIAAQVSASLERAVQSLKQLISLGEDTRAEHQGQLNYFQDLRTMRSALEDGAFRFRRETLIALIPLPGNAALRIAQAIEHLKHCERKIDGFRHGIEHEGLSESMQRSLHRIIMEGMRDALADFSAARDICQLAGKLGVEEREVH